MMAPLKLTGNPLLDSFLDYSAKRLLQSLNPQAVKTAAVGANPQSMVLNWFKERRYGVFPILGKRGSGKTWLSFSLAQFLGRPTYVMGLLDGRRPKSFGTVDPDEVASLPPGSVIIIDDMGLYYAPQKRSQDIHDLINLCRHRQLTILATFQQSSTVDRYILDADCLFLKPPSILFWEYERPEVRKYMKMALEAFETIPQSQWVKHVYAICQELDLAALLTYEPPHFG